SRWKPLVVVNVPSTPTVLALPRVAAPALPNSVPAFITPAPVSVSALPVAVNPTTVAVTGPVSVTGPASVMSTSGPPVNGPDTVRGLMLTSVKPPGAAKLPSVVTAFVFANCADDVLEPVSRPVVSDPPPDSASVMAPPVSVRLMEVGSVTGPMMASGTASTSEKPAEDVKLPRLPTLLPLFSSAEL